MRSSFPGLSAAALCTSFDLEAVRDVDLARWTAPAEERLRTSRESELEPIRAWREVFTAMGLKPTRYRCASEALLRRLRTGGGLPRVHPLVDLCNAVSVATALPVAALDRDRIEGGLEVRHAAGTETYLAFSGAVEQPDPGEIVFADEAGHAHARRWTHRQSARSAVSATTRDVLIVCEGHHASAAADTLDALAAIAAHTGGTPQPL